MTYRWGQRLGHVGRTGGLSSLRVGGSSGLVLVRFPSGVSHAATRNRTKRHPPEVAPKTGINGGRATSSMREGVEGLFGRDHRDHLAATTSRDVRSMRGLSCRPHCNRCVNTVHAPWGSDPCQPYPSITQPLHSDNVCFPPPPSPPAPLGPPLEDVRPDPTRVAALNRALLWVQRSFQPFSHNDQYGP